MDRKSLWEAIHVSSTGRLENLNQLTPFGKSVLYTLVHLLLQGYEGQKLNQPIKTFQWLDKNSNVIVSKAHVLKILQRYSTKYKGNEKNSPSPAPLSAEFGTPITPNPCTESKVNRAKVSEAICGRHPRSTMARIMKVSVATLKNKLGPKVKFNPNLPNLKKYPNPDCYFCQFDTPSLDRENLVNSNSKPSDNSQTLFKTPSSQILNETPIVSRKLKELDPNTPRILNKTPVAPRKLNDSDQSTPQILNKTPKTAKKFLKKNTKLKNITSKILKNARKKLVLGQNSAEISVTSPIRLPLSPRQPNSPGPVPPIPPLLPPKITTTVQAPKSAPQILNKSPINTKKCIKNNTKLKSMTSEILKNARKKIVLETNSAEIPVTSPVRLPISPRQPNSPEPVPPIPSRQNSIPPPLLQCRLRSLLR